eukprot:3220834-Rhodomonas_salina.1
MNPANRNPQPKLSALKSGIAAAAAAPPSLPPPPPPPLPRLPRACRHAASRAVRPPSLSNLDPLNHLADMETIRAQRPSARASCPSNLVDAMRTLRTLNRFHDADACFRSGKVESLALASSGMVPMSKRHEGQPFERWESVKDDVEKRSLVAWASLKRVRSPLRPRTACGCKWSRGQGWKG